jgi:hypothetical protein
MNGKGRGNILNGTKDEFNWNVVRGNHIFEYFLVKVL